MFKTTLIPCVVYFEKVRAGDKLSYPFNNVYLNGSDIYISAAVVSYKKDEDSKAKYNHTSRCSFPTAKRSGVLPNISLKSTFRDGFSSRIL